ncbi:MAG: TRAP transporter permease [bacterium]
MAQNNAPGTKSTRSRAAMVVMVLAIVMSAYQVITAYFGFPTAYLHRPIHAMGAFIILFLTVPSGRKDKIGSIIDGAMIVGTILSTGYLIVNYQKISERVSYVTDLTTLEMILGITFIVVVLEGARRVAGKVLTILITVFLLYGFAGPYLPEPLWHRGFNLMRIVEQIYLTLDGSWGVPLHVTSTYVFLFILFGGFLVATGTGDFFTDFARALTGRTVGGPAKSAVVSSALMGMLSGSSVANVVTTGTFTIPLMKNEGYEPHFAGAVEAAASTGGQIMPPVMGAAAFIMVEFTGIPYAKIMIHAILPAALYFLGIFVMVDLEARRLGLGVSTADSLPSVWRVLRQRGYLFLPVFAIVYFLMKGFTPGMAALWAIVVLMALVIIFDPIQRRKILRVVLDAFEEAPRSVASVTMACAAAGMIVGMILMTGLGTRMTTVVLEMSGGILPVALVLSMLAAIVLGMGVPSSSAYIIMAALLAPGLVKMGVSVIAAHMFVFYFACMSSLTPPVALASYAAAGIARSDPMKTGFAGFRLGIAAYIVPFMFVYGPSLLLIGAPGEIVTTAISSALGVFALAACSVGWLVRKATNLERVVLLISALTLIKPGLTTDIIGIALLAGTIYYQYVTRPRTEVA